MNNKIGIGGLTTIVKIAYRNIFRNMRRSILCIVAIFFAVFFILVMMGWVSGMLNSFKHVITTFDSGHITILTEEYEKKKEFFPLQYPLIPPTDNLSEFVEEIKKIDNVQYVMPRITSYATLMDNFVKHAVLWGVDIETEGKANNLNLKDRNNGLKEGRLPKNGDNECIVGYKLARKMNIKIGDKIPMKIISSQYSDKYFMPEVVGLFDFDYNAYDGNYIIVPFDRLQRVATMKNKTQSIFIFLNDKEKSDEAIKNIENLVKGTDIKVLNWKQNFWLAYMEQMKIIYYFVYMVFIVVASFLIINTIIMVIHERIKEIGMMGALGLTRFEIMLVFFFEALILSIFGSFLGATIGGLANLIFSFFPISFDALTGGSMDMPITSTLYVSFSFANVIQGFVFGVLVSGVCTIIPSLKSVFIEPVEALRR